MKTVTYEMVDGKFGWNGRACENCIFAVYNEKPVDNADLYRYLDNGVINKDEFQAIKAFDFMEGDEKDLSRMRQIAKRLKIRMELRKSTLRKQESVKEKND